MKKQKTFSTSRRQTMTQPSLKPCSLLFMPENIFRFSWELLMMVLALYLGVSVPFILSFKGYEFYPSIFDNSVTGLYILDILINFNTACYLRGHIVTERKVIIQEYLKFWFWVDSLSALPIDQIIEKSADSITYYKAFRLIKVIRIFKLVKLIKLSKLKYTFSKIEDFISNRHIITLMSILKLQLYIFIVAHLMGCLMFSISSEYLKPDSFANLVINKCDDSQSTTELYLTSIYWAYTTMVSIGYGDISPRTTEERFLGIGCMLMSSVTFGVVLGYTSSILTKNAEFENQRRDIIWSAKHYLKTNKVNKALAKKVRMYLEFKLQESVNLEVDLFDLLEILSEPLREQIFLHLNGSELSNCKVFDKFPDFFTNKISRFMHSKTYAPEDDILIESSIPVGIFFIQSGLIQIYNRKSKQKIKELGYSDYFGEIGFFTRKKLCASVMSVNYSEVLLLTIEDFDSILESFPEAMKVFQNIQNSCKENLNILNVKCFLCDQTGHVAKFCNFIEQIREANKLAWLGNNKNSRKVGVRRMKRYRRCRGNYSEFVWGYSSDKRKIIQRVFKDDKKIESAKSKNFDQVRIRKEQIFYKNPALVSTYLSNILDDDDEIFVNELG